MKTNHLFIILLVVIINSCNKSSTNDFQETPTENFDGWTVPVKDIVGNFNPFPLAENPTMSSVTDVTGLNDASDVVIISFNEKVNIYPLPFVHPYETVNDTLNNNFFTVSYCPITQSTITINRDNLNQKLTLRASGILYKENLVMHDNNSNSYWSQMLLTKIKGTSQQEVLSIIPMIETSWKTAKTYFPNALVFTSSSVISSKNNIPSKSTENINNDEKVFGFIENINLKTSTVFIYRYSQFNDGIKLISAGNNTNKIIVGSSELKFITAFINENNNSFVPVQNEFPIIMADNLGNKWNVFGEAESGPDKGKALKPAMGYVASWWAWKSFYANFSF
jgi:hypothetical protein